MVWLSHFDCRQVTVVLCHWLQSPASLWLLRMRRWGWPLTSMHCRLPLTLRPCLSSWNVTSTLSMHPSALLQSQPAMKHLFCIAYIYRPRHDHQTACMTIQTALHLRCAHMQAHTPWLGLHAARDIAQMEMLIFKVVGWRLGCLTAAAFLDQVLCDALSGGLFYLQYQPCDYLSTARQLAAKLLSHTMPGLLMPAPYH